MTVEHGDLRLAFLPEVGGRLIGLEHRGRQLLWRRPERFDRGGAVTGLGQLPAETDMASWWNLGGSKTWPAPQDAWGGPPDPVLDGGPYRWVERHRDDVTEVELTSADDARTGLRVTRTFELTTGVPGFRQRVRLDNVVDRPITWAPWEVCQVDTAAALTEPVLIECDTDAVVDLGRYVGDPVSEPTPTGVRIPVTPVVAKWGFAGTPSTISIAVGGRRLSLAFTVDPTADYPDGGCSAELWMQHPTAAPVSSLDDWQPDAWLVELEVLGPLRTLAPGASTELIIDWTVSAS